jgi:Uma2 family endonuclease
VVSEEIMSSQPKTYLTPEEYLAIERRNEYKSEYIDGEMVAMTGASRRTWSSWLRFNAHSS